MTTRLEKKIDELFIYRKFPELFEQIGEVYKNHPLIESLKKLQAEIYYLDHHLETNWEINPQKDLRPYWKAIYSALKACGVKAKDKDDYCKLIYKYQKHELYLRKKKLPIEFNKEFYYYFKSCDVKLLRRIICDHYPSLGTLYPSAHWRYFDLITEVNDDVEDVFEDMTTINGNYFLIDLIKNGSAFAKKDVTGFIKEISKKDKIRKRQFGDSYQWISKLTQLECKDTLDLLNRNFAKFEKKNNKILIANYIC